METHIIEKYGPVEAGDLLELAKELLVYSAERRITAKQALSKYFKE